jgi:hypothetical protein
MPQARAKPRVTHTNLSCLGDQAHFWKKTWSTLKQRNVAVKTIHKGTGK